MTEGEPTGERKEQLSLEEQAGVYAEMFGVDTETVLEAAKKLQAEMSEQEREELTMLVYVPEGMTTVDAWEIVRKENQTFNEANPIRTITPGETGKAVVAFARYSQEPNEDTLGEGAKSAKDWRTTNNEFMSLRLRMIAGEYYRRAHGQHLDEKNATLCPGSYQKLELTDDFKFIPYMNFKLYRGGCVYLGASLSDVSDPEMGVRRIRRMEV